MNQRGIASYAGSVNNFWLKRQHKRKNRRATKDAIAHGRLDSIPPRHPIKREDKWGWD